MTTNQPESTQERFNRLESFFADVSVVVIAQNEAIDSLTANLNNFAEQATRNINVLAEQAAADRQQAAIDRQAWQAEVRRIWEYLLQQGGNGRDRGEG